MRKAPYAITAGLAIAIVTASVAYAQSYYADPNPPVFVSATVDRSTASVGDTVSVSYHIRDEQGVYIANAYSTTADPSQPGASAYGTGIATDLFLESRFDFRVTSEDAPGRRWVYMIEFTDGSGYVTQIYDAAYAASNGIEGATADLSALTWEIVDPSGQTGKDDAGQDPDPEPTPEPEPTPDPDQKPDGDVNDGSDQDSDPDPNPPTLISASVDKASATVGDTVTVTYDISDLEGVNSVYLDITMVDPSITPNSGGSSNETTSSSSWDSTTKTSYFITSTTDAGRRWVYCLRVTDQAGHVTRIYDATYARSHGISGATADLSALTWEVLVHGDDPNPPLVMSTSVDKPKIIAGDTVTISYDVFDADGVSWVEAEVGRLSPSYIPDGTAWDSAYEDPIYQSSTCMTYRIDSNTGAGRRWVYSLTVTDKAGWTNTIYDETYAKAQGIEGITADLSSLTWEVIDSADVPAYSVTDGEGVKYEKGSDYGISICFDGPSSEFASISVDGKTVPIETYGIDTKRMELTLSTLLLDSLDEGDHTVTVYFKDGGRASATFVVATAEQKKDDAGIDDGEGDAGKDEDKDDSGTDDSDNDDVGEDDSGKDGADKDDGSKGDNGKGDESNESDGKDDGAKDDSGKNDKMDDEIQKDQESNSDESKQGDQAKDEDSVNVSDVQGNGRHEMVYDRNGADSGESGRAIKATPETGDQSAPAVTLAAAAAAFLTMALALFRAKE